MVTELINFYALAKDVDTQPRDEHGRWTAGGASTAYRLSNISASPAFAERMQAVVDALPVGVTNALVNANIRGTTNQYIRDPSDPKGSVRGYFEGGVVVRVGENSRQQVRGKDKLTLFAEFGDDSAATLRHEIGHALDKINVGDAKLKSNIFTTFANERVSKTMAELGGNYGPMAHYMENKSEMFAEAFSAAVGAPRGGLMAAHSKSFEEHFPKTVAAMRDYVDSIKDELHKSIDTQLVCFYSPEQSIGGEGGLCKTIEQRTVQACVRHVTKARMLDDPYAKRDLRPGALDQHVVDGRIYRLRQQDNLSNTQLPNKTPEEIKRLTARLRAGEVASTTDVGYFRSPTQD